MTAKQWTIDGMQACLPEGCPLPFIEIESAKFVKKGISQASVRLFDGLAGTLQVSQYGGVCSGWCLHWQDLPGGAINWNGAGWERVSHIGSEQQLTLW